MVLERDEKVIAFLAVFKLATSNQINQIEYHNINICNRRLKKLCADKILYRERNKYGLGYLYSVNPIKSQVQIKHKLLRVDCYLQLMKLTTIKTAVAEPALGSIRPDALFLIKNLRTNTYETYLLEVETSNNTIDIKKYNDWMMLEYKQHVGNIKPKVIYVTDKNIHEDKCNFKYVKISPSLSNVHDIFAI